MDELQQLGRVGGSAVARAAGIKQLPRRIAQRAAPRIGVFGGHKRGRRGAAVLGGALERRGLVGLQRQHGRRGQGGKEEVANARG